MGTEEELHLGGMRPGDLLMSILLPGVWGAWLRGMVPGGDPDDSGDAAW